MTSRIRALNEQLFQDVQQNKKVTTRKILTDLTKLRRELRNCINKNIYSWCEENIKTFREKERSHEYIISGFCQAGQDATFKTAT